MDVPGQENHVTGRNEDNRWQQVKKAVKKSSVGLRRSHSFDKKAPVADVSSPPIDDFRVLRKVHYDFLRFFESVECETIMIIPDNLVLEVTGLILGSCRFPKSLCVPLVI